MQGKLLRLTTTLLLLGLGACATTPRVEIVKPPANLLSCKDEPQAPDLPPREQQAERDRLTLEYLLGLRAAWGDCSGKIGGLKAWSDALGG